MSLRRQLRFLRAYAVVNTLVMAVLATAAFRQATPQKFDEITPRLTLTVDAAGNPRIEFLDQQGKVVARVPQDK